MVVLHAMTEQDIRQLGALLHDIGKFHFRALPLEQGQTHEHLANVLVRTVLKNYQAFSNYQKDIEKATRRGLPEIRAADIAAAEERQEEMSGETQRYLLSIFSRVLLMLDSSTPKALLPQGSWYLEPNPLELTAPMPCYHPEKPSEWQPNEEEAIAAHEKPWEKFRQELESFSFLEDPWAAIETIITLLEKYTSTVASAAYLALPDITLFDHSRVVAALAECSVEGKGEDPCLLVAGDLGGIQRFLYRDLGTAERRAKLLRGRSLLVRLVTDTVVSYLLDKFNLYRSSVLYSGGGSFELLLPATRINAEQLQDAVRTLSRFFASELGFALQISIATHHCTIEELILNYAQVRTEMMRKLQQAKKQRFSNALEEVFGTALTTQVRENLDELCISLGERVPWATYLVEFRGIREDAPKKLPACWFRSLGIGWVFAQLEDLHPLLSQPLARRALVHRINGTEIGEVESALRKASMPTAVSFRFIGNWVPRDEKGRIVVFEDLAAMGSENYPLLGFARMDVDWLGMVMRTGLREQAAWERKYTLSRVASLSRMLDHFFSGTVNAIAKEHQVYLVYSGGDDLFAVGSWTNIFSFVQKVQEQFYRFVCTNENLTLSCGIVLTKPFYPIDHAAEEAGRMLEMAKQGKVLEGQPLDKQEQLQKNRVAVLDCVMNWKTFADLLTLAEELLKAVQGNSPVSLPRSLVHSLLERTQSVFDRRNGAVRPARYALLARTLAQIRYALARRGVTAQNLHQWEKDIRGKLVRTLLETAQQDRSRNWWNFRLVASYVLWKTR
ncbi:MAG: hypothetical protein NZ481_09340 [Candidatus Kapabacteria bacterium]|nr:hypothetical protein [Candidatus Kapabacteria bacterium]